MITGEERRRIILEVIRKSDSPVPAKHLAELCDVSRQVIVQDMALIRTSGIDIIATNRGYIIEEPPFASRVFDVCHTDAEIEDELCTIVDMGGRVRNVMVDHDVYGHMEAPLKIHSRKDVALFMQSLANGESSPLKNITSGSHSHLVEADTEEDLNLIEDALAQKNYLVKK